MAIVLAHIAGLPLEEVMIIAVPFWAVLWLVLVGSVRGRWIRLRGGSRSRVRR